MIWKSSDPMITKMLEEAGQQPASEPPVRSSDVVSLIAEIQSWADSEMEKEWIKPREMRNRDRMRVLSNTLFHLSMAKGHLKDGYEANDALRDSPPNH